MTARPQTEETPWSGRDRAADVTMFINRRLDALNAEFELSIRRWDNANTNQDIDTKIGIALKAMYWSVYNGMSSDMLPTELCRRFGDILDRVVKARQSPTSPRTFNHGRNRSMNDVQIKLSPSERLQALTDLHEFLKHHTMAKRAISRTKSAPVYKPSTTDIDGFQIPALPRAPLSFPHPNSVSGIPPMRKRVSSFQHRTTSVSTSTTEYSHDGHDITTESQKGPIDQFIVNPSRRNLFMRGDSSKVAMSPKRLRMEDTPAYTGQDEPLSVPQEVEEEATLGIDSGAGGAATMSGAPVERMDIDAPEIERPMMQNKRRKGWSREIKPERKNETEAGIGAPRGSDFAAAQTVKPALYTAPSTTKPIDSDHSLPDIPEQYYPVLSQGPAPSPVPTKEGHPV